MTVSSLVEVRNHVVSDLLLASTINLAGGPLGDGDTPRIAQALNVDFGYVPRFKPSKASPGDWNLYVSTDSEQTQRIARSDNLQATYLVEIGVMVALPDRLVATIDNAMGVLQDIADYHFEFGLSSNLAYWMSNEVIVWPDREGLARSDNFFALWIATFQGTRVKRLVG